MSLQDKIIQHFEGKVVRKDLTKSIKGNAVVPTYVLEYLLGQHCASFDEDIIAQGLEKVKNIIKEHFVHRDEAEIIKSVIKERARFKIIDKVSAQLNEKKDIYQATFSNLGIKRVTIGNELVRQHKKILAGGVWSIITMEYFFSDDSSTPWLIEDLKPIQISNVDLDEFIRLRKEFTKDEWMDLLVQSLGLDPSFFNFRSKLIQLSRLIPFCENNYNFIELGPKGTGKSHIFSELSPHGILVSGGDVTQAKLFVNNTNNQIGLVGFWDVVTFDEFAGSQKSPDKKLVDIMKNYMANKSFSRGRDVYGATASLAFVGNTEHSVPYMLKNTNLFDALPRIYYDTAFLDRIHSYIPGWEVHKLRTEMFTDGYGFIVDYLAEVLKEFRKEDYTNVIDEYIQLQKSLTTRDRDGITKTFSGLLKIIYPDGNYSHDEAIELINFAIEGRKRIKDQLIKMDDTFEKVDFSYTDNLKNITVNIETLESQKSKTPQTIDDLNTSKDSYEKVKPKLNHLNPGQIIIKDNQEGISYELLFSDYLRGARKITLVDPYIRMPHQMRQLLEFCSMLAKIKESDQEVDLKVITWNEPDEMLKVSASSLEEIAESVFDLGIKLVYEFNPNQHDRFIVADNGWKIVLGRGLDIFLRPEGKYNIADIYQEKRKCRACEITYLKVR
ncbi:MAG: BREX system Lon protease-like protein BrxL [Bacteroidetes bacterium]|nr:BREX system Lon protease-like protein BrxL [Bacteroidota bacterium]